MRVAAIDLGTNTVRLLIGEPDGAGGFRPVLADQEITRLGQGLLPSQFLQPEPIRRTLTVLARFRKAAASCAAARIAVVGTSALREAKNREAFLDLVRREAGLEIRVVSGKEEAYLTLLGVRAALHIHHGNVLLMDIGGGSTEFLLAQGDDVRAAISTGLGVVKLTESHLTRDPPLPQELAAIRKVVAARLLRLRDSDMPDLEHLRRPRRLRLVGTAGTVTTLAAIDLRLEPYDPEQVNGHRLSRARVRALAHELASLPLPARRLVRGLEPARADVIVAGALVCHEAMEGLGFSHLTVSDGGLREGILLDCLARMGSDPASSSPRADSRSSLT